MTNKKEDKKASKKIQMLHGQRKRADTRSPVEKGGHQQ